MTKNITIQVEACSKMRVQCSWFSLYIRILYFFEKGAQPTRIVYDILRKAELFKEKERTLS
ncbi:hypothetical protein ZWY2020_020173 [Hordeum vulgare]|nr:hypothetical protein ZWY2020_020173 [Hordeum vulgare]